MDAVGGTRLSRALAALENATAAPAREAFAQVEGEAEALRAGLTKELAQRPTGAFDRAKA